MTGNYTIIKTFPELISYAQEIMSPEKIFVRMAGGDGISAGEYFANLNKISNMFLDLGMKKGCTVAIYLPNCSEYSYLYIALGRLGICVAPINQFLREDLLSHIINSSDSEYLITSADLFSQYVCPIQNSLKKIKSVIFTDNDKVTIEKCKISSFNRLKITYFNEYKNYPSAFKQPWDIKGQDVQGLWYTSGTTGLPKAPVLTQEGLLKRVSFFTNYFHLEPTDLIYFILPMYHQPYLGSGIAMAMTAGCAIVNVNWFSARKFWEHVTLYKATVVFSTGTIIPIMLKRDVDEFEKQGREILRLWAGWPVDQPDVVKSRWPKIRFMECYGLSEYPLATITSYDNPELGSVGHPTPFSEVKICNPENGTELPTGEVGEFVLRGKSPEYMMKGYYNSPEETAKVLKDGWLYTGDLGYIDSKGLVHFVDRLRDSVRVGGENVPSAELESILRKHPKIEEVAVVGVKGELGHSEIIAHVVLKDGQQISQTEFQDFCREQMAYFMVPKYLYVRKELPKNPMLKVQKFKLREEGVPPGSLLIEVPK